MKIVLCILYVLGGILLAIPCCLLAGWSWDLNNFMIVIFVAPVFLFIWFVAAGFAKIIEVGPGRKIQINWRAAFGKSDCRGPQGSLTLFWMWTVYSFLPVIFHWSAVLLKRIGFGTVGSIINAHRYASPLYVFAVILILLTLVGIVMLAREAVKDAWVRITHR